ncbi:hypothetical protein [Streptomyces clavuligerus]|uniref:Putative integral membrane protein n=1 Tax=Streptomyces clavuligerus TaxID=1901 RepID=B5GRJ5_STRCL|nr:hypothetical protein [Streptomyces clavuligerus]EDY48941.1 integral membrane protein [Streptomyces clavuligerus]EFG04037.1 Putative integral membrane protein [Streptomyces clavuligerus]QCS09966.1 hypothetical protein CRV15_30740 [Streptomyces clavuligerus]QPJ97989.1 hypothetical protein GE265_33695 [Streptomyces clavuligerus]WDN56672.1 hypothetical protein LL058_33185 [Streptomyces clavuligerus]
MTTVRAVTRREWGPLYSTVRAALAARGVRAIPLTLVAVGLIAVVQIVQVAQGPDGGRGIVQVLGGVRAEDPLWLALARTPLSLFAPAPDLPPWGALLQVLVVFGVAEIVLGWRRTLLIAYVCTLAGTFYARIGIAIGPGGPLGLPASAARVVDTGPSAAVVGLAVCVCVCLRAWLTGALVVVAVIVEAVVLPNLAGREHLVAVLAALAVCAVPALRGRRPRTGPEEDGGNGPPGVRP